MGHRRLILPKKRNMFNFDCCIAYCELVSALLQWPVMAQHCRVCYNETSWYQQRCGYVVGSRPTSAKWSKSRTGSQLTTSLQEQLDQKMGKLAFAGVMQVSYMCHSVLILQYPHNLAVYVWKEWLNLNNIPCFAVKCLQNHKLEHICSGEERNQMLLCCDILS